MVFWLDARLFFFNDTATTDIYTILFVGSVEDNSRVGGVGAAVAQLLRDQEVDTPVRDFGIPPEFLAQGSRAEVLAAAGLTAQSIARRVVESVARREPGLLDEAQASAERADEA